MKAACPHGGLYWCGRCGRCYACRHEYIYIETSDGHWWRCPDGFVKRTLPEDVTKLKWWEIDPMMTFKRLALLAGLVRSDDVAR